MAGNGSPPAVYNARLRRVVFSSREQHERDLRWLVFSRAANGQGPGSGSGKGAGAREQQVAAASDLGAGSVSDATTSGSCYVGMDSRDSVRALARQRCVDAALRSVLDLPCLRQY